MHKNDDNHITYPSIPNADKLENWKEEWTQYLNSSEYKQYRRKVKIKKYLSKFVFFIKNHGYNLLNSIIAIVALVIAILSYLK